MIPACYNTTHMPHRTATIVISNSVTETRRLAARLGRSVHAGEIIGLVGGLGSGKTVFAGAFACALGVRERVVSPTFVLASRYDISRRRSFYHVDCYRLTRVSKNDAYLFTELLRDVHAVVLIEWADKITALLNSIPRSRRTTVSFTVTGPHTRSVALSGALSRAVPKRKTQRLL